MHSLADRYGQERNEWVWWWHAWTPRFGEFRISLNCVTSLCQHDGGVTSVGDLQQNRVVGTEVPVCTKEPPRGYLVAGTVT